MMKSDKKGKIVTFRRMILRVVCAVLLVSVIAATLSACGFGGGIVGKPSASVSVTDADTMFKVNATTEAVSTTDAAADNLTVVPTAASTLTLIDKDTEAFTMQIPDGWEMRYGWDGEKMLLIRIYDPKQPVNQIFYATDMVPFMKNQASADMYAVSGTKVFSEAPVLDPPTNETLFKQIPSLRTYYLETLKSEATAEMIPEIYNFELLETLPASSAFNDDSLDDSILYGTFRTADGSAEGEGIGFASIVDLFGRMESPLYGVEMSYYNVYNFTIITSVKDEFVNYEDILCKSFSTLKLKQEFVEKMLKNNEASFTSLQEINASITASYYSYNSAWLARSQSSDISRQKWSDATLGYERVYDTETGEIYKAYNGFTDEYTGSRYQPITDDMYSQGWSGYIEN